MGTTLIIVGTIPVVVDAFYLWLLPVFNFLSMFAALFSGNAPLEDEPIWPAIFWIVVGIILIVVGVTCF